MIPQTLNINNKSTTVANSINLDIIKSLLEHSYSLKNVVVEAMFLSLFLHYCYSKVCWYNDPHSRSQESKGLNFQ